MNNVSLSGRIVRDPELRTTNNGTSVLNFSLAVRKQRKNQQGEYDTNFFDFVAWGSAAEFIAQYFKKGDYLGVKGRLDINKWQDKNNQKRKDVEVVVESAVPLQFALGTKDDSNNNNNNSNQNYSQPQKSSQSNQAQAQSQAQTQQITQEETFDDDFDVPF